MEKLKQYANYINTKITYLLMKPSIWKGFSFGLTSGIITTLGLIVGLNSSTHSKSVIIAGILTIAISDSLSDALGIHISEESVSKKSTNVWESTFATLFTKILFALSFMIPILLFDLNVALIISVVWGIFAISAISYKISRNYNTNPWNVIIEHLTIAVFVIFATHFAGILISSIM